MRLSCDYDGGGGLDSAGAYAAVVRGDANANAARSPNGRDVGGVHREHARVRAQVTHAHVHVRDVR